MTTTHDLYEQAYNAVQNDTAENAKTALLQVLKHDPNHGQAQFWLASLHMDAGEYDVALPLLDGAVQNDPSVANFDFYTDCGYAHSQLGNLEQSACHYKLALQALDTADSPSEDDSAMGHRNLGDVVTSLYEQNMADVARPYVAWWAGTYASHETAPKTAGTLYDIASELHEDEEYEAAQFLYEQALILTPDDVDCVRWLADVHLHMENYETAISYYDRTIGVLWDGDTHAELETDAVLATYGVAIPPLSVRLDCGLKYTALPPHSADDSADDDRMDDGDFYNDYGLCCYELSQTHRAVELYLSGLLLGDHGTIHGNLGMALYQLYQEGETTTAQTMATWWAETYPDNVDAGHIGVAIGGGNPPKMADATYVAETFDDFAEEFDQKLLNDLDYQAPKLLHQAVRDLFGKTADYRIVDLGCGTGLCGEWLRDYANDLIGVDLSPKMLDLARDKGFYDTLSQSDLTAWLNENAPCHLAVAGDVFCYIGDLADILGAWQNTAIAGERTGYILFTVEHNADDTANGYILNPSGRYRHTERYIRDVVQNADLHMVQLDKVVLRYEYGEPVNGLLAVAKILDLGG